MVTPQSAGQQQSTRERAGDLRHRELAKNQHRDRWFHGKYIHKYLNIYRFHMKVFIYIGSLSL